jgi:hypothetical protein
VKEQKRRKKDDKKTRATLGFRERKYRVLERMFDETVL